MDIQKLSATPRPESGKGPSSRLRQTGQIPAIAYGKDLPATQVAVSPKALKQVLGTDHGQNVVIELGVEGGGTLMVMLRDYAYHPITRDLLHADFFQVKLDQHVDVEVPLRMTGKAKGVVTGGVLQQIFRKLPIRCLPVQIPATLEVDVTELDLGESIKTKELKLPEGVRVRLPDEQTIIVVNAPDKVVEEEAKPAAAAATAAPAKAAAKPAGKDKKK